MSYTLQVPYYKMAEKSRSTASSDTDLQVIRGSQLSSKSSDYLVLGLIGKGAFAKVAKCVKTATNETVAVRITKTHSEAEEEDGILQKLRDFDPDIWSFVRWDGSFIYKAHLCQEFELLDMTLKEFVTMRQPSSLPLKEIQYILYQVATALQVLKSLWITHTDLTPENIMLVDHVSQPLKVKLIDFGSACDASKAKQGSYIQQRWYKAPETILGVPCNEAIDMWSLGCIAAELFLGFPLYPGCCEYETIWQITQTQGPLPGYFLSAGLKTSHFYRKTWPNMWKLKTSHEYGRIAWIDCRFSSLDDLKKIQQKPEGHPSEADAMRDTADLEYFVELVKEMLQLDPTQRTTPSEVLQHPFITMSHLIDFCHPQSLESTQQPPSENQSTSPQQPLLLSTEDASTMAHVKPLEKRKRAYAEISQRCNKSPDGTSTARKKRKILEGTSLPKRSYPEVSKGSKTTPEFSPERKRRRVTKETEEEDKEQPSTSKEVPSTSEDVRSASKEVPSTVIQLKSRRKKANRKETKPVPQIWIIGSSYIIRRGEEAAYENFGENFGLNAKVEWFGKGGMRWSGVLPCFYEELSNTQSPPDILVVHAGGNDLGLMSANKLASIMMKELMQLHAEFPSMTIAYSCINEQQWWGHGPWRADNDRKAINKCMRKAVGNFDGEVIEHPRLRRLDKKMFLADGVHFTKKGNGIFVNSIHCVLVKILQKRR